jgi:hypothetical protein
LAEKSKIFHFGRNSFGVSLWLNAAIGEKPHASKMHYSQKPHVNERVARLTWGLQRSHAFVLEDALLLDILDNRVKEGVQRKD